MIPDLQPNQYRFPRTFRDAFGVEQMTPLPKRITFLHGHQHIALGDALVVLATVLIALAFVAGWLK